MEDSEKLQRVSRVRKTAAVTGTSFDYIKEEVSCPTCGRESLIPLAELAVNGAVDCRYCGADVDVSTKEWRDKIGAKSEVHQKIAHTS